MVKIRVIILMKINTLNGWQRLYVLFSLITVVVSFLSVNEPEIKKSELPVSEYLPNKFVTKGENCDSNGKCSDKIIDPFDFLLAEKDFKVSDGTVIFANKNAKQEEVESAYVQALNSETEKRKSKLFDKYKSVFSDVIIFLVTIYTLGWMIGWVRSGFKNSIK